MNIITVIPLSRAKVAPELTYFTASEVPVGAIVTVPLRSKTIHGIVTKVANAEDLKIDIKNAPFEIRKLGKVKATAFFPASFIASCAGLAEYYATTIGAVVDSLIADSILENAAKIAPPLAPQNIFGTDASVSTSVTAQNGRDQTFVIQGDDADRMSSWRSLIRQEFARKKSIAMYVPTVEDGENLFAALSKGIEGYIFKLNGGLSKKRFLEIWTTIAETDHPIVVIATGSFPLLPRHDIETIVIERESARGWISQKNPYIDGRYALEYIGRKRRQTVFIADSMLRAETLYRLDQNEVDQGSPFKWRSISTATDFLVNMRTDAIVRNRRAEARAEEKRGFRVLSPELVDLIQKNRDENTHLFILTVRRGLSPMTVCEDCETIVSCRNCSSPVVLHTSEASGRNFFMCHKCGERRSAEEVCVSCSSWRLAPIGIGIDRVMSDIRDQFPGIDIFKIDADTTKTEKEISSVLSKFKEKPGSVILATELGMLHLTEKIDHVAVVSLDSLFALPDFRIEEKVMYTLTRLRAQAIRTILVQTRRPDEKAFEFGLKGKDHPLHEDPAVARCDNG